VIMSVPAYEVIVARTCRVDHMMYINVEAGVACERMSTVSSNDKRRPVRTHAHTHTHTHRERERERGAITDSAADRNDFTLGGVTQL
jgi:hypothetical protein